MSRPSEPALARRALARRALALTLVMLPASGCPIAYGLLSNDEWARDFTDQVSATYRPGSLESIAVVDPFPKRWETTWLYDGGEAERLAHILWKRFPDRHVHHLVLPVGTKPEEVEAALARHDTAEVRRLLDVDYPIDALVLGRVEESDFDNAYQEGFFTTRKGIAKAYDLAGRELWSASGTVRASVTHVTWDLAEGLAERFPD